jgi:hypothetical protein
MNYEKSMMNISLFLVINVKNSMKVGNEYKKSTRFTMRTYALFNFHLSPSRLTGFILG